MLLIYSLCYFYVFLLHFYYCNKKVLKSKTNTQRNIEVYVYTNGARDALLYIKKHIAKWMLVSTLARTLGYGPRNGTCVKQ